MSAMRTLANGHCLSRLQQKSMLLRASWIISRLASLSSRVLASAMMLPRHAAYGSARCHLCLEHDIGQRNAVDVLGVAVIVLDEQLALSRIEPDLHPATDWRRILCDVKDLWLLDFQCRFSGPAPICTTEVTAS